MTVYSLEERAQSCVSQAWSGAIEHCKKLDAERGCCKVKHRSGKINKP